MSDEQLQASICSLLYTLLFCFVFMLFVISFLIFINCQPGVTVVDDLSTFKKTEFSSSTNRDNQIYRTNSTICKVIEV